MSDYKSRTLKELEEKRGLLNGKFALVGLDGFVDRIVTPVSRRMGQGEDFEPIETIEAFGKRVLAAAGKSTNIEIFPRMEKIGGNGPIMAQALSAEGLKLRYIGALGKPAIHDVFKELVDRTNAVSLCEPGITTAVEFDDGKLMLGLTSNLESISYESILEAMSEGQFFDQMSRADLIALVNWTMIPNMTSIFRGLLDKVLPNLPSKDDRLFFFDLADPEKRSDGDIVSALRTISEFQNHGRTVIGLNLKEAQLVARLLDIKEEDGDEPGVRKMATKIRQALQISVVVVHPRDSAGCATRDDSFYVPGPLAEKPLITTGAGDHFNAGFVIGQLIGLSPEASLTTGACTSGYYVRTARSPSLNQLDQFIRNWK